MHSLFSYFCVVVFAKAATVVLEGEGSCREVKSS